MTMTKTYRDALGRPNHVLTQHEVVRTMRRAAEMMRMLSGQIQMARSVQAQNEILADGGALAILELEGQTQRVLGQIGTLKREAMESHFNAILDMRLSVEVQDIIRRQFEQIAGLTPEILAGLGVKGKGE